MTNTNHLFNRGTLTILGDATFGSSGKGKIGSYICEHADNWQFACNSFSAQAGHWVRLDDGRSFFYQHLNSCAYKPDRFEKIYIGPDSAIELPALLKEYEQNGLKSHQLGVHPLASIIQDKDMAYERGEVNFDGESHQTLSDGTKKHGSTCHGTGPARVRKMLRRKDTVLARDIPALKEFICDVSGEIMNRLDAGQAGLLELAQGWPLSLNHLKFYPHCTNRNVSVSAALDGMMLPPIYAGAVILNFRTFPIRINSRKFIGKGGKFLTWDEVKQYEVAGDKYEIYDGNSGHWYSDQKELTWEELTIMSGSPTPLMEITSVTKLPRRVATWSNECLNESVRYNRTNYGTSISINFANYVDYKMAGVRGGSSEITQKFNEWLTHLDMPSDVRLDFIGTGALTDDMIVL